MIVIVIYVMDDAVSGDQLVIFILRSPQQHSNATTELQCHLANILLYWTHYSDANCNISLNDIGTSLHQYTGLILNNSCMEEHGFNVLEGPGQGNHGDLLRIVCTVKVCRRRCISAANASGFHQKHSTTAASVQCSFLLIHWFCRERKKGTLESLFVIALVEHCGWLK